MTREEALELCKAEFQKELGEFLQENVNLLNLARLHNFMPPEIIDVNSTINKEVERSFKLHEQFASSCDMQDIRFISSYLKMRIKAAKGLIFLASLDKAAAYLQTL